MLTNMAAVSEKFDELELTSGSQGKLAVVQLESIWA
jgi:hypothetical protein